MWEGAKLGFGFWGGEFAKWEKALPEGTGWGYKKGGNRIRVENKRMGRKVGGCNNGRLMTNYVCGTWHVLPAPDRYPTAEGPFSLFPVERGTCCGTGSVSNG